jgi:hypothetical protein
MPLFCRSVQKGTLNIFNHYICIISTKEGRPGSTCSWSQKQQGEKCKKPTSPPTPGKTRIFFWTGVHVNQGHNPAFGVRPQRDREGEKEQVSRRRERGEGTGSRSGALHRLPLLLPGDEQDQDPKVRWLQLFPVPRPISSDSVKSVYATNGYENPSRCMISDGIFP